MSLTAHWKLNHPLPANGKNSGEYSPNSRRKRNRNEDSSSNSTSKKRCSTIPFMNNIKLIELNLGESDLENLNPVNTSQEWIKNCSFDPKTGLLRRKSIEEMAAVRLCNPICQPPSTQPSDLQTSTLDLLFTEDFEIGPLDCLFDDSLIENSLVTSLCSEDWQRLFGESPLETEPLQIGNLNFPQRNLSLETLFIFE